MANSYKLYTANGSTRNFSLVGIDGWISSGFLKVYVNDVIVPTGYAFFDLNTAAPYVRFDVAPANLAQVRIQRETPNTVAGFQSDVVDFNDGSVLTASDLDKVVTGLVHVAQEAEDTGSGALGLTVDETNWNADSKRITNMDDGINAQDAVTMNQFTTATLYGGSTVIPQVWYFNGNGGDTYALSPAPLATTSEMFLVEVGGVLQQPSTYTISSGSIVFNSTFASTIGISVRNFGVSRNIIESVNTSMIQANAVTTAKINDAAVTTAKINDAAVTTAKINDDAVTYAKIQNVTATNKVLGRSSTGSGNIEEISCSPAGRDLIAGTDAAAQRTTLGLGSLAVKSTVANADLAGSIGLDKLETLGANVFVGRAAAGGTPQTIPNSALGRSLVQAADNATFRNTTAMYNNSSTNLIGFGSSAVATTATSSLNLGQVTSFKLVNSGDAIGFAGQSWFCFIVGSNTGQFGATVLSGTSTLTSVLGAAGLNTGLNGSFVCIRVA